MSRHSVSGQVNKGAKITNYHQNVNETIEEAEEEKEDIIEHANNVLTKSIERRRKAAKFMHNEDVIHLIDGNDMKTIFPHSSQRRKKATLLVDGTDPIYEEQEKEEQEDDAAEYRSDSNFYDVWQRHK